MVLEISNLVSLLVDRMVNKINGVSFVEKPHIFGGQGNFFIYLTDYTTLYVSTSLAHLMNRDVFPRV